MKVIAIHWLICAFVFLLLPAGCEPQQVDTEPTLQKIYDSNGLSIYTHYAPSKVYILPLTELTRPDTDEEQPKIKVYVSLLDSFGSQIKSPGVFRFELYKYVQRSIKPKGKRIAIWPDIDLTNPVENNKYWLDFLRAYEFNFPFESESDKSYMLQATCLCPNGRRLSAEFALKHAK